MNKIINKVLLLGTLVASVCGVVGCDNQPDAAMIAASDFIYQLYNSNVVTPSNYDVAKQVKLAHGRYDVDWAITYDDAANDGLLTIQEKSDKYVVVLNMNLFTALSEPASYTLTYTLTSEAGKTYSRDLTKKQVPSPKFATVTELLSKPVSDTEYYRVEGVVTTVNKLNQAGAFTISDGTSNMYCHDGIEGVTMKLGQKITIACTRADYSGFPQIKNAKLVEAGAEGQLSTVVNNEKLTTISYNDLVAQIPSYAAEATKEETVKNYANKFYKITGSYLVRSSDGYYGLNDTEGTTEYTKNDETFLGVASKKINLYYHTNNNIKPLANTAVDLYGVIRGMSPTMFTVQIYACVPAGTAVTF